MSMPVPRTYNVLSPHLDDAALSCALVLVASPGSRIVTVFADGPPSVRPLTAWDKAARFFTEGADVMGIRRAEDRKAADLLGASAEHLPFWDSQYRTGQYGYSGPEDDELPGAVTAHLVGRQAGWRPDPWLIPLGLGHRDHRLAAEAGLRLAGQIPVDFHVYEDLPYAVESADDLERRKAELRHRGFTLEPAPGIEISPDRAVKAAAIACHASQRRSLRRRAKAAARVQERVWTLTRQ
jgi:LmbE family N-acetylglucosaminyl deacetylase